MPASVVTIYCYYLCYSALSSDDSSCNTLHEKSQETAQLIVGMVLGAVSVSYAGWSLANAKSLFGSKSAGDEVESSSSGSASADGAQHSSRADADAEADAETGAKQVQHNSSSSSASSATPLVELDDDEQRAARSFESRRSARFHWVMASAAMYMGMLLTG